MLPSKVLLKCDLTFKTGQRELGGGGEGESFSTFNLLSIDLTKITIRYSSQYVIWHDVNSNIVTKENRQSLKYSQ